MVKLDRAEHILKDQEGINKELLKRVEKLSKEKAKKEEECALKTEGVIATVKSSDVEAIWEANIKLSEDVENAGS